MDFRRRREVDSRSPYKARMRVLMRVLERNRGVQLELGSLIWIERLGFRLVPPLTKSPQYNREKRIGKS